MKSIRLHLLTSLLPGFLVLWVGAGIAVFFAVRSGWERRLESELREIAGVISIGSMPGTSTSLLNLEDISAGDIGIYFQIWSIDGQRLLKSRSLGQFELIPPAGITRNGQFGNQHLESGDRVKTLAIQKNDYGGLGQIHLMVAKSRDEASAAMFRLAVALILLGLGGAASFALLLNLSLKSGLKPLVDVGEEALRIDADSMGKRFPEGSLPSELTPIVARLNELLERLEVSFARERRFSGDLAHEFRNPVAALRSIAEAAISWPDEATEENYRDIKVIAENLQSTIENILTLARIENGRARIRVEPVPVRSVVRECWNHCRPDAELRGVTLEVHLKKTDVVDSDPELFRILLSNLIINAADYTPDHSTIRVYGREGGSVFSISNPAPHLQSGDLPLLFDRLWRHDRARTDSSHSGLGLSLARECAGVLALDLEANLENEDNLTFRLMKKQSPGSSFQKVE